MITPRRAHSSSERDAQIKVSCSLTSRQKACLLRTLSSKDVRSRAYEMYIKQGK